MSNGYSINITLDDYTLSNLPGSGMKLVAYKGVQSDKQNGNNTVWFTTGDFTETVTIEWEEQYGGYISEQQLSPGIKINSKTLKEMDLGEVMDVHDNGTVTVKTGGNQGEIIIDNDETNLWTCGMGQVVNGELSPFCAFPLFANGYDVLMLPYEKVLLLFSSKQADTGTVVAESLTASILIELDGVNNTRNVSYSLKTGWAADEPNVTWAKINKDSIPLAGKLIVPPVS